MSKVFSSKEFAKMASEVGMPEKEIEMVFSVFNGLSRDDFYKILDKLDNAGYEYKIDKSKLS